MPLLRPFSAALMPVALLAMTAATAGVIETDGSNVALNVDTAPNAYGSSDWEGWWSDTKRDVAGGEYTNMRSGAFPGSKRTTPEEQIVYSTGDLGQRLHWTYWMPETSLSEVEGNFQSKVVLDWADSEYTYDASGAALANEPGEGWLTPSSWQEYEGGVIGTFGHAWWATDNYAEPLDTNDDRFDETDQADIDALAASVLENQTFVRGMVRTRSNAEAEWQRGPSLELDVTSVPTPGTLALLGAGLLGAAAARRRRSA